MTESASSVQTLIPSNKKSMLAAVDALRSEIVENKVVGLLFVAMGDDGDLGYCIRSQGKGINNIQAMGMLEYLRIQFIGDYFEKWIG